MDVFFLLLKNNNVPYEKTTQSRKMYLSLGVNDQIKLEGNEIKLSSYLFFFPSNYDDNSSLMLGRMH